MKKLFFAFLCLVSLSMFTSCEGGKNDPEKDGKWYTAASQINLSDFDNEDKNAGLLIFGATVRQLAVNLHG